jgi:plastocyanin
MFSSLRMFSNLRVLTAAAVVTSGCGGSGGESPAPAPTPTPPPTGTTVTITAAGVSPRDLTVAAGTRVTFINNDSRPRNITSNEHPEHLDCVEINDVGRLNSGQSRQTGNLVTVRTCGYHDHDDPDSTAVQGRIIIR